MIIQCEQCQTRFRLDDSKVTEKGVKVRCAKCKHVFTVRKEEPETEISDFGAALEPTSVAAQQAGAGKAPVSDVRVPEAPFSFGDDTTCQNTGSTVQMESDPFDAPLYGSAVVPDPQKQFGLPLPQEEPSVSVEQDQKEFSPAGVSFEDFDFGDSAVEAGSMATAPAADDFTDQTMIQALVPSEPDRKEEPQGLDFSDDDMFGAVVAPAVEEPGDSISFDFGTDSFADSIDAGAPESGQKGLSAASEATGDAPFSLGEIDFGDELTAVAVQQVNPDELKPSQEILFAPLAEAQKKPAEDDDLKKAFLGDEARDQEELPPLSITSRRKQSSFFNVLIAVVALVVVAVLGYFGFSAFSPEKSTVAQEAGKITVRSIKASYVKNAELGTLLVISGEALNEYPKPRAALQVKGTTFDAAGRALVTKTAYCGNPLNNEQLESMPLDKIEAAMSNQFGDSLANLEVAPGKVVPFTIVIVKPPKEGKDFAVEPVGSTVATGKQQ